MSLIERLEAAEVGSAGLSIDVVTSLDDGGEFPTHGKLFVTTSLDAALALAERVLPGWSWTVGTRDVPGCTAVIDSNGGSPILGEAIAPTPALALCIAILRARQASNPTAEEV